MPGTFTQEIHDYAMKSEDNLIVLVRAVRSFDEVRETLISGFSKELVKNSRSIFL